jgi:hypothetical protein
MVASIGYGQNVTLYQNYSNGVHSFRWKVDDPHFWQAGIESGFLISKTNLNTGEIQEFEVQNTTRKYLALGEASEDERYLLALLMADDMDQEGFLTRQFDDGEIDLSDVLLVRQVLSDYILNTNYLLIMESGFGWRDEDIVQNTRYRYQIKIDSLEETLLDYSFDFNTSEWQEPSLPEIEAKWGNKRVELNWRTKDLSNRFYAYELSQAINGGMFSVVDSLIANPSDTSAIEALQYIVRRQFLASNDTTYTFRIRGRDFLGMPSENYTEVSGKGNIGIGASPQIVTSDLLNTNKVDLEWSIYNQFEDQVEEWRIYVGQEWDGPYSADTLGILPEVRRLVRPLPYENNYFRVVAVDINEVEHSSFPMLVTHLDTTPPAIPGDFIGSIDSAGVVQLDWADNSEDDFYGYKVFFGFDTTAEMTLAHFKAFPSSEFRDTIGLKSMNRELYYKVTAIDNRNNRSAFSKIISLTKPDVIAPMEPNFHTQKSGTGEVTLAWYRSRSGDVVNQKLFRRAVSTETSWSLIKEWGPINIDTSFIDRGLTGLESYAYILTVTDSSGNTSLPSNPIVVKVLPNHSNLNLENWTLNEDKGRVIFEHAYEDQEIYEIRLFKQIENTKPFELSKLSLGDLEYIDLSVPKGKQVQYFIQVIYNDGFRSSFSQKKTVLIDD